MIKFPLKYTSLKIMRKILREKKKADPIALEKWFGSIQIIAKFATGT
jgi:hypothetical protein